MSLTLPTGFRFVASRETLTRACWFVLGESARDRFADQFFSSLPDVYAPHDAYDSSDDIVAAIAKASEAWRTEKRAGDGRWTKSREGPFSDVPRLVLPRTGFDGERGRSLWRGTSGHRVEYRNGFPVFECAQIDGVSAHVTIELAHNRNRDFALADHALAHQLNCLNSQGRPDAARVRRARKARRLTWHHSEQCGEMMLVPTVIHSASPHSGGFSLCQS